MKPKVALTRTGSRAENIEAALRLIEGDIKLAGKERLVIKVNLVSTRNQLAATHVEGVRALLRFLRQRYQGKITIAESSVSPAREGYLRFGYEGLVREFDVELVDLNEGDWETIEVYDVSLRPLRLHFSRLLAESDYRIVIGPAKTHDTVVVSLSIKNLAMGGLRFGPGEEDDKRKMHQGYPVHNLNLYLVAKAYPPHLSIIDGYLAMEGDGPLYGQPVDWGVAIASSDPVAADSLAAQLMGFSLDDIGYLWYCGQMGLGVGEMEGMEVLGVEPEECRCLLYTSPSPRD